VATFSDEKGPYFREIGTKNLVRHGAYTTLCNDEMPETYFGHPVFVAWLHQRSMGFPRPCARQMHGIHKTLHSARKGKCSEEDGMRMASMIEKHL
jgi:hypothetical protein